jgi:hypothetical protein
MDAIRRRAAPATTLSMVAGLLVLSQAGCREDGPPTMDELQAAYGRAAAISGGKHDPSLTIVGTDCAQADAGRYLCQVGYRRAQQVTDRVFIDAALFQRSGGDWQLLSGLCRRPDPSG